ncbi:hypothetical protein BYT27DRAFT_7202407 [Phlegmacium glaucopus]|nr:hypothetical protein BYT27DRAFT_7202407 [Phlegmacium glaucopus]
MQPFRNPRAFKHSEKLVDWFSSRFSNYSNREFSRSFAILGRRPFGWGHQNHLNGNKLDWSTPVFLFYTRYGRFEGRKQRETNAIGHGNGDGEWLSGLYIPELVTVV